MADRFIFFIIFLVLSITLPVLGGCSNKDNTAAHAPEKKISQKMSDNSIQNKILKEFRKWEGTPQRWGVIARRGLIALVLPIICITNFLISKPQGQQSCSSNMGCR